MYKYDEKNFQKVFGDSIDILKKLKNNNYEAYFVGGCVRDYILDVSFDDIDITTNALPNQVKEVFKKTIDTGIKHGTVTVCQSGGYYEVTTFRTEDDYINFRSPSKVEFVTNLELDLERRDFTINAMALGNDGKLKDFHGGIDDLNSGIIRTVNNPNERFTEDALRMLRAFRFVAKLGFDIDENTYEAIKNNAHLIENISVERIVAEFQKIFKGKYVDKSTDLLIKSGLVQYLPFFNKIEKFHNLKGKTFNQNIYNLIDKEQISISELNKLKLSNKDKVEIKNYISIKKQFLEKRKIEHILYYNNFEEILFIVNIFNFMSNEEVKSIYKNLPITNFKNIEITNKEIIEIINKPVGPWIKDVIKCLEENILDRKLENKKNKIVDFLFTLRDNM